MYLSDYTANLESELFPQNIYIHKMKTKKQLKKVIALAIASALWSSGAFAQTTQANNVRPATTAYLGWDGTGVNSGSLDIINKFNQPMNFYTNNLVRGTFTAGGNLGIGTTAPNLVLEVQSAGGPLRIGRNTGSFQQNYLDFIISSAPGGSVSLAGGSVSLRMSNTNAADMAFMTNPTTANMVIKQSGNIGIGTYAPVNLLDVTGSMAVGSYAGVNTAPTNGLIVSGNVGIGTTSTASKLDVAGDVNIGNTNAYKINGSNILWHNGNNNDLFAGYQAGNSSMTGHYNTFLGSGTGNSNTSGYNNSGSGFQALNSNTTGTDNTANGYGSLTFNGSGSGNTATGSIALSGNNTGNYNTAMGAGALYYNQSGSSATAIGYYAMYYTNNTATAFTNDNVAVGYQALMGSSVASANTGNDNTAIGYNVLKANTTGSSNTALGSFALSSNTTGDDNIAIGYGALNANTTGFFNTAIGFASLNVNTTGSYNAAFGIGTLINNTTGHHNTALGPDAMSDNTTGAGNTAIGDGALNVNTTGGDNTAIGEGALSSSTTASFNTAIGEDALNANTTGTANTAIGAYSMLLNTTGGNNTAVGNYALNTNTTGTQNSATGVGALYSNSTGNNNSAFGTDALNASTADNNTAIGVGAGVVNTTGTGNTFIGTQAGQSNTTGSHNTFVGYLANADAGTYTNSTGIGYQAPVKTSAAGYAVIGNAAVSSIGGYVGWTTYVSDVRCKKDVQENVPGLAFIKKLRPVTYHLDMDQIATINKTPDSVRLKNEEAAKAKILYSGFIAQEVEKTAQQLNYDFSGNYIPQDPNDLHGLTYSDFVMPLVKATQELSGKVDSLTSLLAKQDSINKALQNQIASCCANSQALRGNNNTTNANGLSNAGMENGSSSVTGAVLYQNNPNPFSQQTNINYFIPTSSQSASLMVFDLQGKPAKTISISSFGAGSVIVNGNELNAGMYVYSLVVDGKIVDTKRMILTE